MIRLVLGAALLLLASCTTPDPTYRDLDRMGRDYQRDTEGTATPQNEQQATAADTCHASRFHALIGAPASAIDRSTLPPRTRIISPGMMVTQDFAPERLNIRVAPDGKVAAIQCF
ncbi:MAG: I78 family peptidase inhibitor [Vitreimonas sp.]